MGNPSSGVSLDYATNSFNPNDLIVTGGSWSLVVVRENQYAGTLYGEVQTGSVNLITDDSGTEISKQVRVNLKADGGLGIFNGRGSKDISGVYDMMTDLRSKETPATPLSVSDLLKLRRASKGNLSLLALFVSRSISGSVLIVISVYGAKRIINLTKNRNGYMIGASINNHLFPQLNNTFKSVSKKPIK